MKNDGKGAKPPKKKDRVKPDKNWTPTKGKMDYRNFKAYVLSMAKEEEGMVEQGIGQLSEVTKKFLLDLRHNTEALVALAYRTYPAEKPEADHLDEPEQPETEEPGNGKDKDKDNSDMEPEPADENPQIQPHPDLDPDLQDPSDKNNGKQIEPPLW